MLKADYMQAIQSRFTLNAGSQTTYSGTYIDDRNDVWAEYPYKRWQEYLYAGFDNNRSKGKFHYALSLGLDMLFSEADGVHHHYVTVLPSVSLSYMCKDGHTLGLSYRRSRTNPTAEQLNPRNISTDSLYIQRGNPYLMPEVKDNVQLSYTLNYKSLYLEPYVSYSRLSDLISQQAAVQGDVLEIRITTTSVLTCWRQVPPSVITCLSAMFISWLSIRNSTKRIRLFRRYLVHQFQRILLL